MENGITESVDKKTIKIGCGIFLIIPTIVILAFVLFFKSIDNSSEQTKSSRQTSIESQFSVWDGSHINLTKTIKKSMHNPKSYDHVKTVWYDHKDYLNVVTQYRGENLFGGVVTNNVIAKVSLNGDVLEILDGSEF